MYPDGAMARYIVREPRYFKAELTILADFHRRTELYASGCCFA